MGNSFWTGFIKQADLMGQAAQAARKGRSAVNRTLRYVKKAPTKKSIPVAESIDYSGTAFTKKNPVVTAPGGGVVEARPPAPPAPKPVDVHAQAAQEIARRRESLQSGSVPHTMFQDALAEGVKNKKSTV